MDFQTLEKSIHLWLETAKQNKLYSDFLRELILGNRVAHRIDKEIMEFVYAWQ